MQFVRTKHQRNRPRIRNTDGRRKYARGETFDAATKANDPTGTRTLRSAFATSLQRRWRMLETNVREALITRDAFGMKPGSFVVISTDEGKLRAFQSWFDAALRSIVVGDDRWFADHIRRGYSAGLLRGAEIAGAKSGSITTERTKLLIEAAHAELQGIAEVVSQRAVRAMTEALVMRSRPENITREIVDIVRDIGIVRSRMLASYAIVKAHATGTLDVLEASGVKQVGIIPERIPHARSHALGDAGPIYAAIQRSKQKTKTKPKKPPARRRPPKKAPRRQPPSAYKRRSFERAERKLEGYAARVNVETAHDDRVCPICEEIAASGPYDIDTARTLIPAHIRCRCGFSKAEARDALIDHTPGGHEHDQKKHGHRHGRGGVAVDPDQIFYHGTRTEFEEFSHEAQTDRPDGAFYFATKKRTAENYSTIERGGIPRVIEANLDVKNAKVVGVEEIGTIFREDAEAMRAQGYDGVIAYDLDGAIYEVGVFDPQQVRQRKQKRDWLEDKFNPNQPRHPKGTEEISASGEKAGGKFASKPLTGSAGHPELVSTRHITSTKKATENSEQDYLHPSEEALKLDPKDFAKKIDLLKDSKAYPNLLPHELEGTDAEVSRRFIDHVKGNLKSLWESVPSDVRAQTRAWYEGANKFVNEQAARYGLKDSQVAAVYAALSPQNDWFQNVSAGDRVLDIYNTKQNFKWNDALNAEAERIYKTADQRTLLESIRGKSLGELNSPAEKAAWIRAYDQSHNDRSFREIFPDGSKGEIITTKQKNLDGSFKNATMAWKSNRDIAKAVAAIESNGSRSQLTDLLGEAHKVRSFYNNMLDPWSANRDVTIDTHAVGAALLRPMSANDFAVNHNLGTNPKVKKGEPPPEGWVAAGSSTVTGNSGTYGLYATAYREAAADLGVLPRELQSVTWTKIREIYPSDAKSGMRASSDAVWNSYNRGEISLTEARRRILSITRDGLDFDDFDPNQERWPKGHPKGGEWKLSGGMAGAALQKIREFKEREEELEVRARENAYFAKEKRVLKEAVKVAEDMGYDSDLIHIKDGEHEFFVNGENYKRAGRANLSTGEIELYPRVIEDKDIKGITAHEVMHQKFERVMDAFWKEESEALSLPVKLKDLMSPGGVVKAPFDKQFPVYAKFNPQFMMNSALALAEDDGVTKYSKAYWDAFGAGDKKVDFHLATHETLAEIGRINYTKRTPAGSPRWRKLYTDVINTYPEVKRK